MLDKEFPVGLTKEEISYLFLLTTNDMSRINYQLGEREREYTLEIRHSVRLKLFQADKPKKLEEK